MWTGWALATRSVDAPATFFSPRTFSRSSRCHSISLSPWQRSSKGALSGATRWGPAGVMVGLVSPLWSPTATACGTKQSKVHRDPSAWGGHGPTWGGHGPAWGGPGPGVGGSRPDVDAVSGSKR
ncbi:hypothetical protein EYF80_052284 [Liparis tanakae]|uniref:Uncharacterized protein n=1 Tax=Liparis tanakae TaxID=230148 RepID=A0A4Z2FAZ2_9TELE|nr:hypothetical protein EYF80_052284 [Liparis tanakae]